MSFTEITKGIWGFNGGRTNTVTMWKGSRGGLMIRISRDILTAFRDPKFLRVLVGSGEHKGLLLLAPTMAKSVNTYSLSYNGGPNGGAHIGVSAKKAGMPDCAFTSVVCSHELTDEGIVIRLPVMATSAAQRGQAAQPSISASV